MTVMVAPRSPLPAEAGGEEWKGGELGARGYPDNRIVFSVSFSMNVR